MVIWQDISNPPAQQDTNYGNTVPNFSRNDITSTVVHVLQAGPLQGLQFQGGLIVLWGVQSAPLVCYISTNDIEKPNSHLPESPIAPIPPWHTPPPLRRRWTPFGGSRKDFYTYFNYFKFISLRHWAFIPFKMHGTVKDDRRLSFPSPTTGCLLRSSSKYLPTS
jgi:hypothetical protein